LVPWLAVLCLLMLKPNRTARGWWVWVPLAFLAASEFAVNALPGFIPSQVLDIFGQMFSALGFGIASVWLLATFLSHRLRILAFLKMLAAALVVTVLVYLVRQDWDEPFLVMGFLIYVGICVLVVITALSLAGLVCRRQYRPFGLMLWVFVFITALWFVISAPFFVIALVASRGALPWREFFQMLVAFAGVTFGIVLPFLLLAFANGLFRERLKLLLHLSAAPTPPPVVAIPPPVPDPPNLPNVI